MASNNNRSSYRIGLFPLLLATSLLVVAGCGTLDMLGSTSSVPPEAKPVAPTVTPQTMVPDADELAQQTQSGQTISPAGWSATGVALSFHAQSAPEALIPEVEVTKDGQPFVGTPTAQGAPLTAAAGTVVAQIAIANLAPGQYRWQARFSATASGQHGKWTAFSGTGPAFGVVGQPPTIDHLALAGAAASSGGGLVVNAHSHPSLQWTVSATPTAALDHIAYLADDHQQAIPTPPAGSKAIPATDHSLDVNDLEDGQWYLHLWAMDKAGQTGAPATIAVTIARTPPVVSNVVFRSWATNPLSQTVPIRFTLSRSANVDLTILEQQTSATVRVYHLGHQPSDQEIQAAWDGKDDHGQMVPTGSYAFLIDVLDDAGNSAQARYNGLSITDKMIRVSLGKELLAAYAGSTVVLTTTVTTGGQALPTPTGTFEILSKESPFVFHSPFPKGSPYWYPDVTSQQAMLFYQPDADFIHDAPWRTTFGPGSNGPGIPGSTFTGSHGCVELPAGAMPKLFEWTPLGTPVIVTP